MGRCNMSILIVLRKDRSHQNRIMGLETHGENLIGGRYQENVETNQNITMVREQGGEETYMQNRVVEVMSQNSDVDTL